MYSGALCTSVHCTGQAINVTNCPPIKTHVPPCLAAAISNPVQVEADGSEVQLDDKYEGGSIIQ